MRLLSIIHKIWIYSSNQSRCMVAACFALMLVNALAELVTLGSVGPFIYALANPEKIAQWLSHAESEIAPWAFGGHFIGLIKIIQRNPMESTAALFLAATTGSCLVRISFLWVSLKTADQITRDFSLQAFNSALTQPYERQISMNSGEIITCLSKATSITSTVTNFLGILNASVLCCFLASALIAYQPSVTVPVIILLSLLYGLIGLVNRKTILAEGKSIATNQTAVMKILQESLGSIREIIIGDYQKICVGQYERKNAALRAARAKVNFISGYPKVLFEALGITMLLGVSFFSLNRQGHQGDILPLIAAFAFAGQRLLPGLHQIFSGWAIISNHSPSVQEVFDMVERNSPKIQDAVSATEIFPMNRALNLVNVKFAYRDRSTPVLQGVNMEIKQGQWVGIVGGTGCGKSSLLDLVIGLLAPSEGHLEVDGKKIVPKEYLIWKNNFSLVPQHVFLLDGSITDNIKFFSAKKYSNDIVRTASSLALVDEFAVGLPQGFETRVGERGAMLSGGQRQRIGIARALARQTPFLVLDEATNALDERTEKCLLENLRRFAMGKTVLVISHHPRTLAFCDAVYEICDGKAHLRSKPHCTFKST